MHMPEEVCLAYPTGPVEAHEMAPGSHAQLLQVSLGSQRHTTRAAKAVDGRAVFDQRLAFIATLPLTNRTLKLVLFATNSVRNQGKKLAHAYIPVSSLLPPLDSGDPARLTPIVGYRASPTLPKTFSKSPACTISIKCT